MLRKIRTEFPPVSSKIESKKRYHSVPAAEALCRDHAPHQAHQPQIAKRLNILLLTNARLAEAFFNAFCSLTADDIPHQELG